MNSITRQSMPMAAMRGTSVGVSATSAPATHLPSNRPSAPAASATSTLSVRTKRMIRAWRRPEGGAERDLTAAPRRAREEQVGHVRTGDQQHQRDRAHQDPERASHAGSDVELAERREGHPAVLLGHLIRIRRPERLGERCDVGLRLLARHALAEPGDRRPVLRDVIRVHGHCEWDDHLHRFVLVRKRERLREHADDRDGLAVQANRAAHHVGSAPEAVSATSRVR